MTNEEIVEKIKSECVKLCEDNLYTFNDEQNRHHIIEEHQILLDKYVHDYPKEYMELVSRNGGGDSISCELDFGNGDKHIIKSKLPGYVIH